MAQQQRLYEIGLFRSSTKNTNTQMHVYVSDKHVKVDLFAANFKSSPNLLEEYLHQVKRQEPGYIPDETDEDGEFNPLDEMHGRILKPFLQNFRELAPLDQSRKYTLQDCLFADELRYTVQAVEGELVPVSLSISKNKKHHHLIDARLPSSSSTEIDYSMFSIYHPREIQVQIDPNSNSLPGIPCKVFIHGRPQSSFFKVVYGSDERTTMGELLAYSNIQAAQFDDDNALIRTSRLHVLVQDEDG